MEAALRFVDSVERTVDLLSANPLLGEAYHHPRFSELRCRPLSEFRGYVIFYQTQEEAILIIRVLRGARDLPATLSE